MTELFSIITEIYDGLATFDLAGAGVGLVFAGYICFLGLF